MSLKIHCDGCDKILRRAKDGHRTGTEPLVVEGERVDGMQGGTGLGDLKDQFHWCAKCAGIAFKAVQDAQLAAAGLVGSR